MIFIKSILIWLIALGDTGDLHRTGPSYCTIKIVPVAYGASGAILFKTYFQINTSGGHILVPQDLGWLVVSSSGVWEEKKHLHLDFDDGVQVTPQDSACLREFDYPFNFNRPLPSVQPLLKRYGINKLIRPDTGKGTVTWSVGGKGASGKVVSAPLRSVNGVRSQEDMATSVTSSFHFMGVALFSNALTTVDNDDSQILTGPIFLRDVDFNGERVWIEHYQIDAVVVAK